MARSRADTDAFAAQFERLPGMGRDPASIRRRIELMEHVLEEAFTIPGTRQRVGLDAILGVVPVVGDVISALMGAWIVWEARTLGLSRWQLTRMSANVGIDTVLGAVPIVGDVFDIAFRSNRRNLRIVRRHLDKHHPGTRIIDQ